MISSKKYCISIKEAVKKSVPFVPPRERGDRESLEQRKSKERKPENRADAERELREELERAKLEDLSQNNNVED